MIYGIIGGVLWALETIVIGIALAMSPFLSSEKAIFLAPFVSTFLHDAFSAVWATGYNLVRLNERKVINAVFHTKSGRFIILGALIGGPVGMTGYVLAVNNMGSSIGAVASAVYPAIGSVLAFIFLKEKMPWYRWILLIITLFGVYGLSYSPDIEMKSFGLGVVGALMCSFGWGTEAVILAKSFQDAQIKDEYALQIRQTTSALFYGAVLLPVLKGWGFTVSLFTRDNIKLIMIIAVAALFATSSYLFYYKAISKIGPSKAMALNVSYSAWAIVFTVIILRDTSVLTPLTVGCSLVVIICSVLSAADINALFNKKGEKEKYEREE